MRTACLVAVFGCVLVGCAPGETARLAEAPVKPTTRPASPKVVAEFDIPAAGRVIVVPVQFQGKTYSFDLDTGSTNCFFDESFRRLLGDPVGTREGITGAGPRRFRFYAAPDAQLGPLSLKNSGLVACLDMRLLGYIVGRDLGGIVGMSVLRKYVVRIDFDRGRLTLLAPDDRQHPEWGRELPLDFPKAGVPLVTARIAGGAERRFVVDTGDNGSVTVPRATFRRLVQREKLLTVEALFTTAGGTVRKRSARLASVSVGDLTCKDLILDEGHVPKLGLGWLSRFRVTFDFPNRRMYLAKGAGFHLPDEADMSGLHILRIDGRTVVYSVDKGSPAEGAGVRAKDVILTVNGKPAQDYEMFQLRRLLCSGDKKKITMTIQRQGRQQALDFLLERRI